MRNAGAGSFQIVCRQCRREVFARHKVVDDMHFNVCEECGYHNDTIPRVRHMFQRRRISYAADKAMRIAEERRRIYELAIAQAMAARHRGDPS